MHHVYVYVLHLCEILLLDTLMVVFMVVRHDFMLICDIFLSCVLAHITLLPRSYSNVL